LDDRILSGLFLKSSDVISMYISGRHDGKVVNLAFELYFERLLLDDSMVISKSAIRKN